SPQATKEVGIQPLPLVPPVRCAEVAVAVAGGMVEPVEALPTNVVVDRLPQLSHGSGVAMPHDSAPGVAELVASSVQASGQVRLGEQAIAPAQAAHIEVRLPCQGTATEEELAPVVALESLGCHLLEKPGLHSRHCT